METDNNNNSNRYSNTNNTINNDSRDNRDNNTAPTNQANQANQANQVVDEQQQSQRQNFRRVHDSSAKPIKGRSILNILYDRSIRGPKGIGGIRRNQNYHYRYTNYYNNNANTKNGSRKDVNYNNFLSSTSPSSVIHSNPGSDDDDDDNEDGNQNDNDNENYNEEEDAMMEETPLLGHGHTNANNKHQHRDRPTLHNENDDMDSLSEVLRDSHSLSEEQRTRSDSLSDVLNITDHSTRNTYRSSSNTTTITNIKSKIPPRLKMNSYPCNHFTELRNFAELYTVTKFDWSYLSLHSREEIAQFRNSRRNQNSRTTTDTNTNTRRTTNGANDTNGTNGTNTNTNANHNNESIINDTAISTISIAFSPDGKTIASTHGDHTVKITCCNTGALIRNLEGHPRTPWTVKYHPTKSNIVASGCLGFQVRIWDWNQRTKKRNDYGEEMDNDGYFENDNELNYHLGRGVCLNHIRLQSSIISLSFHPTGSLLAVASGHSLHLWIYDDSARSQFGSGGSGSGSGSGVATDDNNYDDSSDRRIENGERNGNNNSNQQQRNTRNNQNANRSNNPNTSNTAPSTIITQIRYEHNLRCVYFPPGGDTIILGGVNPPQFPGDTSYSLRLWDFDLEVALNPQLYLGEEGQLIATEENGERRSREALTNFRTILPRALLYGDGGFDVSPDGTKLCGCAEFWLPDGVESVMELIERKEELAWIEEEKNSRPTLDTDASSSERPLVRSPRRKMKRQQHGKEEKRRKETMAGATGGNQENDPPAESSGPRITEGCRTPPNPIRPQVLTSPPLPPGRKWSLQFNRPSRPVGGQRSSHSNRPSNNMPMPLSNGGQNSLRHQSTQDHSDGPPPPPLPPSHNPNHRPGIRTGGPFGSETSARHVPHVVVVNLDKSGNLGRLLEATPLGSRATSVTCVKFSPSTEFCLLGYGVREHSPQPHVQQFHPVTALYNVRGGISHVSTMLSSDDDVNIAMFHPNHGHGFVYGTKQGRVKVVSPRPWNHYYE